MSKRKYQLRTLRCTSIKVTLEFYQFNKHFPIREKCIRPLYNSRLPLTIEINYWNEKHLIFLKGKETVVLLHQLNGWHFQINTIIPLTIVFDDKFKLSAMEYPCDNTF